MLQIDDRAKRSYYEAALRALRFVDARSHSGRRFGAEADAMWKSFRGHLSAADRLDILLRDADIETGGAFGARVAFGMKGVAEDDAFGADWTSLTPIEADELYRQISGEAPAGDVASALASCARAWGVALSMRAVVTPKPADKLLIAGPNQIAAYASVFDAQDSLSFADQTTVVATPPAHRHLAALAAALLRCKRPPRIVSAEEADGLEVTRGMFATVSDPVDDAHAPDRAMITSLSTYN